MWMLDMKVNTYRRLAMRRYLDSLRFRYGLRWPGRLPRFNLSGNFTTAMCLLAILVLYGIVGRLNYEEELASQYQRGQLAHKVAMLCLPHTENQVALAKYIGGTLSCTIVDNSGYGLAPRLVRRNDLPSVTPEWVRK